MNLRAKCVLRPFSYALAALFLELLLAGTSVAQQWPIDAVYTAKDKSVVPIGEQATTLSLDFPALQHRDGKRVCLRLKAYLDYPKPAGWNPYLAIAINGHTLGPLLATGENRLINRGQFCETKVERHDWWGRSLGGHALLTFIGPGDVLDDRVIRPRDEPYWYVLDISDEVHFVEIGADGRTESRGPTASCSPTLVSRST